MGRDGLVLVGIVLALTLIVAALSAAVGVVVAERWARGRGSDLARERLAAELGTRSVEISIDERPLVPALLRRPGIAVRIHATDVPVADGALLRDLFASVRDVRVDLRKRVLTTDDGTFAVTIDERELGSLVHLPNVVTRLELRDEGLRAWTVLGVGIDVEVIVLDGALRLVPDPVQVAPLLRLPGVNAFRRTIEGAGLRLELPVLPFGAIVEELSFTPAAVVATGRLAPQVHRLRRRA